jgi:uncharacterized protein (DUF362 family)
MNRRQFVNLAAFSPLLAQTPSLPKYQIISRFERSQRSCMPGPYRARAVRVLSQQSIDIVSNNVRADVVKTMLSTGLRELTGAPTDHDAWSQFISKEDVVGVKVNCSGAPAICSNPEVVAAIAGNLMLLGVPPEHIFIYERFQDQLNSVKYHASVPPGVNVVAAEPANGLIQGETILGYDPDTYVDVNFFGEEDTRSNLIRLVSERFTKIINVPNIKEHQASGVTGCLKNLAYGNFSNVARSHRKEKTNTFSFIGTLASVEPLPSRAVLHVVDGLRGVWHGGPFLRDPNFLFFPKQIMVGTDPVALDRLLIDIIEEKRRKEGAPSVFDRSPAQLEGDPVKDVKYNHFIREPGHVEYAGRLGLGEYAKSRIQERVIEL